MAAIRASMSEKTIPALVGVAKIASSVRRYFAFTNYDNILCHHMQALSDSIEQQRQSEDKVTRGQVQKCKRAEAQKGPRIRGFKGSSAKVKRTEVRRIRGFKGSSAKVKRTEVRRKRGVKGPSAKEQKSEV
jgi:hypothetical protein